MTTDNKDKENRFNNLYIETLPARIKSNKPRCPKCHVSVTDIGTCPYCETIVTPKWKPAPVKEKYEIIRKNGFVRETTCFKKVDNSFFKQFTDFKNYFDVQIHKIHGGPVKFQTYPRLKTEINELEKAMSNKKAKPLYKITKASPCECGCTTNIIDQHHGQILCPACGNVHETLYKYE